MHDLILDQRFNQGSFSISNTKGSFSHVSITISNTNNGCDDVSCSGGPPLPLPLVQHILQKKGNTPRTFDGPMFHA